MPKDVDTKVPTSRLDAEMLPPSYKVEPPRKERGIAVFYSFRGGVGRTMALQAAAQRLAAKRRSVLMVDADLEAPGLTIALLDSEDRQKKEGFVNVCVRMLQDIRRWNAADSSVPKGWCKEITRYIEDRICHLEAPPQSGEDFLERIREEMADVNLDVPSGHLALLPVGQVFAGYANFLQEMRLNEAFLERIDEGHRLAEYGRTVGGVFADFLRKALLEVPTPQGKPYDYILLDSRTGLADVAGLCLRWLSEWIVIFTGVNAQNVDGTLFVIENHLAEKRGKIEIVLTPLPEAEVELRQQRIQLAVRRLQGIEGFADLDARRLIKLHYHPRLALEENDFADANFADTLLSTGYDQLTERIQELYHDGTGDLISRGLALHAQNKRQEGLSCLATALACDPDAALSPLRPIAMRALSGDTHDLTELDLPRLYVATGGAALEEEGTLTMRLAPAIARAIETQPDDSDSLLKSLRARLKRLFRRDPDKARALAAAADSLATVVRAMPGICTAEQAKELFEELFEEHAGTHRAAWAFWGTGLGTLARGLWDAGRHEEAHELFRQAFERYARAIKADAADAVAWNNWGADLGHLAVRLWDAGRHEEAHELFNQAFEKYARATDAEPSLARAWNNWGATLLDYAERLSREGSEDQARRWWREGLEKLRKALAIEPSPKRRFAIVRQLLLGARQQLTEKLPALMEARALLDELLQSSPDHRGYLALLAACLSDLADLVPEAQRPEIQSALAEAKQRLESLDTERAQGDETHE